VALSINLSRILAAPGLPGRAGETIVMLSEALIVSLLGLVPQSYRALAIELVAIGLIGWAFVFAMFVSADRVGRTRAERTIRLVLGQLATLPVIVVGIASLAGVVAGPTSWPSA
jgi:hypothetical protein